MEVQTKQSNLKNIKQTETATKQKVFVCVYLKRWFSKHMLCTVKSAYKNLAEKKLSVIKELFSPQYLPRN